MAGYEDVRGDLNDLPLTSFYNVHFPWKGRGQHAVIRLRVMVMSKNLSCDWSMRITDQSGYICGAPIGQNLLRRG